MSGSPDQLWINLFAGADGVVRCRTAHPRQDAALAELRARRSVARTDYVGTLWSVHSVDGRRFGFLDLRDEAAEARRHARAQSRPAPVAPDAESKDAGAPRV